MAAGTTERSPFTVTLAVWRALFLREAVARLSRERAAWLWLLAEPMVHIVFVMFLFTTVRVRVIGGIDTVIWVMIGFLAFFMFRRPAQQAMGAVAPNRSIFTYRQVKPVDTVLVRAGLEGFLMVLVAVILVTGAGLYGLAAVPADPLAVLEAFFGLWLVGLGFGLIGSVAEELVPLLGRIITLSLQPLYFFSGVIFPLARIPSPYREWLLLNPVAHGVDAARLGYAPYYQAVPELSIAYLYACALGFIFLGLALHYRLADRIIAR